MYLSTNEMENLPIKVCRQFAYLSSVLFYSSVFILFQKCEESRHCNRLDFAAILANTHHRLVKYPLLLDNLNKATPQGHSDYKKVEESARYCKDILNYVNDEIKRVEDELRIIELSKKIEDRRTIKDNDQNNDNDGTDQAPGTLKAIKVHALFYLLCDTLMIFYKL